MLLFYPYPILRCYQFKNHKIRKVNWCTIKNYCHTFSKRGIYLTPLKLTRTKLKVFLQQYLNWTTFLRNSKFFFSLKKNGDDFSSPFSYHWTKSVIRTAIMLYHKYVDHVDRTPLHHSLGHQLHGRVNPRRINREHQMWIQFCPKLHCPSHGHIGIGHPKCYSYRSSLLAAISPDR